MADACPVPNIIPSEPPVRRTRETIIKGQALVAASELARAAERVRFAMCASGGDGHNRNAEVTALVLSEDFINDLAHAAEVCASALTELANQA